MELDSVAVREVENDVVLVVVGRTEMVEDEVVVARAAEQGVAAAAAVQGVGELRGYEPVVLVVALDRNAGRGNVVKGVGSHAIDPDILDAPQLHRVVRGNGGTGTVVVERDHRAAPHISHHQRVEAVSPAHDDIVLVRYERVVAAHAVKRIVPTLAAERVGIAVADQRVVAERAVDVLELANPRRVSMMSSSLVGVASGSPAPALS